ncbi:MAG: hypothetical protein RIT45_489 [Pseudomonadota bacterium]
MNEVEAALASALRGAARQGATWTLDLRDVVEIDSAGAAWIAARARTVEAAGGRLQVVGAQPHVAALLGMLPAVEAPQTAPPPSLSAIDQLGARTAELAGALAGLGSLFADAAWFTGTTLLRRHRIRPGALTWELSAIGSQALGVVGLIAFLVGGTMALQSAAQLRRFGADLFVVDLIALSMLRELGPLMAAIVVAGRSGSAIAAELGTMVVTEEVDALRTLGLDPVRFLVVPKLLAFTVAQPLLALFADALGVLGGLAVAVLYLDIGPGAFFARLEQQIALADLLSGLGKSVIFAWLICLIGAFYGLHTRGGAEAVGRSTTASVVAGIFAVVVADAIASILLWF